MSYPGGKAGAGVTQTLINLMPPHTFYMEPFLGAGAVMQLKRPAALSVGIDNDILVTAMWANHNVPGLIVELDDGIRRLKAATRLHSRALVYCDPPYLAEACQSKRSPYRSKMTLADHRSLLAVIRRLPCLVMISHYSHPLYEEQLKDWRRVEFHAMTRGNTKATEVVWMNYPTPHELHDYRFLGGTFRDRERIKRRQARWVRELRRMPELERKAMLATLQECDRLSPAAAISPAIHQVQALREN
jgi:hypothetical protein